jgi:hypothetical protein
MVAGHGDPAAEHFGDTPGLRDASSRRERLVAIEDFTDGSDSELR